MVLTLNQAQAEAVANAMVSLNNVGARAVIGFPPPSDITVIVGGAAVEITRRHRSCFAPHRAEWYPTQHDFFIAYELE